VSTENGSDNSPKSTTWGLLGQAWKMSATAKATAQEQILRRSVTEFRGGDRLPRDAVHQR
jgi:hypothetical protein